MLAGKSKIKSNDHLPSRKFKWKGKGHLLHWHLVKMKDGEVVFIMKFVVYHESSKGMGLFEDESLTKMQEFKLKHNFRPCFGIIE